MKIYKNKKSGFSLIEVSIVIIVITILIVTIIKTGYIVAKTRINSARSLTSGAPVTAIPDLFAWWEPVMETSFNKQNQRDGEVLENLNGGSWFDRSGNKNHATTVTGSLTYKERAINDIPAINFPGTAENGIEFDASDILNENFTVFVVDQRLTDTSSARRQISWGGGLGLGYINQTTVSIQPETTPLSDVTIEAYSKPQPRIITYVLTRSLSIPFTQGIFINGGNGSIAASTSVSQTMSFVNSVGYIGRNDSGSVPFFGDIAEIIVYTRALDIEERNEVQKYLSKKYNIKITPTTE